MKYYDDITFIHFGEEFDAKSIHKNRTFKEYYTVNYIYKGNFLLDGKSYSGPRIFITGPGKIFNYRSLGSEGRHHLFLSFNGKLVSRYISGGLFEYSPENSMQEPLANPEVFLNLMRDIITYLNTPSELNYAKAVTFLELLLIRIHELKYASSRLNGVIKKQLENLIMNIKAHPLKGWDFELEAKKLSISSIHFSRCFKQCCHCSPYHFVLECRLNQAARLLTGGNKTIREIAFECGFDDEFYFSRLFKKSRRMSPRQYRREFF